MSKVKKKKLLKVTTIDNKPVPSNSGKGKRNAPGEHETKSGEVWDKLLGSFSSINSELAEAIKEETKTNRKAAMYSSIDLKYIRSIDEFKQLIQIQANDSLKRGIKEEVFYKNIHDYFSKLLSEVDRSHYTDIPFCDMLQLVIDWLTELKQQVAEPVTKTQPAKLGRKKIKTTFKDNLINKSTDQPQPFSEDIKIKILKLFGDANNKNDVTLIIIALVEKEYLQWTSCKNAMVADLKTQFGEKIPTSPYIDRMIKDTRFCKGDNGAAFTYFKITIDQIVSSDEG